MLKIVYPICCGIDVHKTFVVACIASTNEVGITAYQIKRFSTFTKGLRDLSAWLMQNSCRDVCMESTGKYFYPVYNILEETCNQPIVAHPKYVKAIRGKKTDKKDAKWIADLFKHNLIANSFIPPLAIRQLRDLMRYRFKLTNFQSSEKNRFQNCLTVSNIQLASVVSDTFGKSSMNIIEKILENPLDKNIDIASLIHGSMVDKIPDLELAIDGVITEEQAEKIKIIKTSVIPQYNTRFVCFCTLIQTPINGFRTSYQNSLRTLQIKCSATILCYLSTIRSSVQFLCQSYILVPIQVLSLVLLGRSHNACHVLDGLLRI